MVIIRDEFVHLRYILILNVHTIAVARSIKSPEVNRQVYYMRFVVVIVIDRRAEVESICTIGYRNRLRFDDICWYWLLNDCAGFVFCKFFEIRFKSK